MRTTAPSEEALAYRVTQLFLQGELQAQGIADRVNQEFPALPCKLTRENVYPLVRKASKAGFLRLHPPLEEKLARDIEARFACPSGSVRVVDCPAPGSNGDVSVAAAEWALELVRELQQDTGAKTIGVGLGPGRATLDFSRAFSLRLREDPPLPKLNLVALSAGGPARYPDYVPVSFFNLFPPASVNERIGLFAETLVETRMIDKIRRRPGCREAFEAAKDIHLVVTSMGDKEDEHALLSVWYSACETQPKPSWWEHAVGDIQYRPYGKDQFLEDEEDDLRAVTLFELKDLVALAQRRDRHVILIARQCGLCQPRRTKAKAVRPILENPHMRVFSRLVLDSPTADELLADAPSGDDRGRSDGRQPGARGRTRDPRKP